MSEKCLWIYRPGTLDSHFALTTCTPGNYNYLSKIGASFPRVGVADWYNGRLCPICGKEIKMDYRFVEEVEDGK